jgi:hypothetical protein
MKAKLVDRRPMRLTTDQVAELAVFRAIFSDQAIRQSRLHKHLGVSKRTLATFIDCNLRPRRAPWSSGA